MQSMQFTNFFHECFNIYKKYLFIKRGKQKWIPTKQSAAQCLTAIRSCSWMIYKCPQNWKAANRIFIYLYLYLYLYTCINTYLYIYLQIIFWPSYWPVECEAAKTKTKKRETNPKNQTSCSINQRNWACDNLYIDDPWHILFEYIWIVSSNTHTYTQRETHIP